MPRTPHQRPGGPPQYHRRAAHGARVARLALAGGVALALGLGACVTPPERPPVPPPKERYARAVPRRPASPPVPRRPELPGLPPEPGPPPDAAAPPEPAPDGLHALPPVSRKDPRLQFYDAERPCFSHLQAQGIKTVLFWEYLRPDWPDWLDALNRVFHDLRLDCDDAGFLTLVLTTIQLESGIEADPLLPNTDLAAMFSQRLEQLGNANPLVARMIQGSELNQALRDKLHADTQRGHVKRESDLVAYVQDDLRPWVRDYLERQYGLPDALARLTVVAGIPSPVHTLGPMQVNVTKAWRNARARGEAVESPAAMERLLLDRDTALVRGLTEGVYLLHQSYGFYRERLAEEEAVRFAIADYNAGEFSSRNAAFQARVAELSGQELALDGDLLIYQNGWPLQEPSRTEQAVISLMDGYGPAAVRQDLLLEKRQRFVETTTWERVCALYRERTGKPCLLGTIPAGAVNEVAEIKLGRAYSPRNYAYGYLKRFRINRPMYEAAVPSAPAPAAEEQAAVR